MSGTCYPDLGAWLTVNPLNTTQTLCVVDVKLMQGIVKSSVYVEYSYPNGSTDAQYFDLLTL